MPLELSGLFCFSDSFLAGFVGATTTGAGEVGVAAGAAGVADVAGAAGVAGVAEVAGAVGVAEVAGAVGVGVSFRSLAFPVTAFVTVPAISFTNLAV
ncbi:unannotated protein [freshwater metagenome]|uniref:Unannotated protein n=1 Tax=freshwater metagenome TaxID=449393 RepID=A0A6J7BE21_9ZZZZ